MNFLPERKQFLFLYIALSVVYLLGLFVPLMENDAAQHASMAMRMALDNDFLHIYKGDGPYLDKPHLHFWLAALSMKIFGINTIAYRIPSLLFLVMAAACTYRLGSLLYRKTVGHIAALMFLSAQTIILSAHDVRTDAILTGAVALGIYHTIAFISNGRTYHILLGGLGAAMALGSKGMVGVGIIGLCVLSYLAYSRAWSRFFRWRVLWGLLVFVLGVSPVVYAYYIQFDLHPELIIRGETNVSGVRYILWDQSFKRFSGEDFGTASSDYLFFFHTLLWVFIPFSVLLYGAVFHRTAFFIKTKFTRIKGYEFLTTGGFWTVMLVFSFSKFKLPHYLNSLIPVASILAASYATELAAKRPRILLYRYFPFQYLLIGVGLALMVYLAAFAFGIPSIAGLIITGSALVLMIRSAHRRFAALQRFVTVSVYFAVMLNVFLNSEFYPVLTQYQAGLQIAKQVKASNIQPAELVMPVSYTNWTLDFYTGTNIRRLPLESLPRETGRYLFVTESDLELLKDMGLAYRKVTEAYQYRITMVKPAFLNPRTRQRQLTRYLLVKITENS